MCWPQTALIDFLVLSKVGPIMHCHAGQPFRLLLCCWCPACMVCWRRIIDPHQLRPQGERFVGFGSSTFSFYLQFYRRLWGIPLRTNRMIHMLDRPDQILEEGGTVYGPEE